MIVFTLSLLLATLGPIAPDVRGATRCPSPEEVAGRLRPLLPVDGELPAGAWLEIVDAARPAAGPAAGTEIEVRMMAGAPPRTLGVRRLSVSRSCDEAAQAVAVVAATWIASYLSPPPLWFGETAPDAPQRPVPAATASDAKAPAPPGSPSPRDAVAGAISASGAAGSGEPPTFGIGAALGLAAATAGSAAPFLSAELDVRPRGATSARLLVMAVGARTIALGSGQAAWRRLMAGAGVAHTWGTPAAQLQIGGDVLAGATFMEGRGFAQNARTTSFDAAIGPWVRAGARLAAAPVTVWVGAQGLAWVREQRLSIDLAAWRDTLPRLDLLAGAGISWTPAASNRPGR